MAVHELKTNAVKRRALSVYEEAAEGMLNHRECADDDGFVLNWAERNRSRVTEPKRSELGLTPIQRGFAHHGGGEAEVKILRRGCCRDIARATCRQEKQGNFLMTVASEVLAGKRVLIVEDEMLVALLIEDLLADMGCTIVGPYGTVAKALEAARTEVLDLAVLDVNLGGERVYPVAELLSNRNIPFIFLSGYGEQAVPPGHAGWKVCAKPFKAEVLVRMLSALLLPEVG